MLLERQGLAVRALRGGAFPALHVVVAQFVQSSAGYISHTITYIIGGKTDSNTHYHYIKLPAEIDESLVVLCPDMVHYPAHHGLQRQLSCFILSLLLLCSLLGVLVCIDKV